MKNNKTIKAFTLVLAMLMLALTVAACSPKKITVTIDDNGTKSEVEIEVGKTVKDALDAAKITLGDKDECEPKADEKIAEDTKLITVKRSNKVTIIKDGKETSVEVLGGTVEDALNKANITLGDGESVDVDLKTALKEGMVITITKTFKVSLTVDGKTNTVNTAVKTVQDFLNEQGVTLGKDDEVSEKLTTAIADGMTVTVKRVTYKEETATETVDYDTEEKYDSSKAQGTSEVTRQGVEGEKKVTYNVKYVDGKEADRELLSEELTKAPVTQIITYGTYVAPQPTAAPQPQGKTIVSKTPVYDCDGSGHGYNEIHYSDGSVEYEEF